MSSEQELSQRDRMLLAEAIEAIIDHLAKEQGCLPSDAAVSAGGLVDFASAMRMDFDGDWVDLATRAAKAADDWRSVEVGGAL